MSCNSQISDSKKTHYRQVLLEKLETLEEPPLYFMDYDKSNCYVEFLLNDHLISKAYNYNSDMNDILLLNKFIHNFGKQSLTIKIKSTDSIPLNEQSYLSFRLYRLPKKSDFDNDNFSNKIELINFSTNDNISQESLKKKINLSGLFEFEKTFEFDAHIPFTNPDFSKIGKDLSKYDPKKLKQKAFNYFKKLIHHIENTSDTDKSFYWKTMYDKIYLDCLANYKNQQEIDDYINNSQLVLETPNLSFSLQENYKLSFYSKGRIVALEDNSNDLNKKGKSILQLQLKDEKGSVLQESNKMQFYFYMPIDSEQ